MLSRGQVERDATEINALHASIGPSVIFHDAQFRVLLLEQPEVLARIRCGERYEVEGALAFLEVDPWFYRSGYLKERVLHALKKAPWEVRDEARLEPITLRGCKQSVLRRVTTCRDR